MNPKSFRHLAARLLGLAAICFTLTASGPAMGGDSRSRKPQLLHGAQHFHLLPPHARPFRTIYSKYQAKWWQWLLSMPADHNPLTDTADISAGQSGAVCYLGGVFDTGTADRTGTVPAGKALFFPVLNLAYFLTDPTDTEEASRSLINTIMDHIVSMSVEIDGKPVSRLADYRTESALFPLGPLPAKNLLGLPRGATTTAVDDGIYLLLLPLAPGKHTIHAQGEVFVPADVLGFEYGFTQNFTYHLTVAPRR